MADNLSRTSTPVFALPDHALVVLEGPDAVAFAHAQFANDVVSLAPGNWQWNAWLTPKGRVIAVFALAKRTDGSLWLVLPDHPAGLFAETLRRFVFRRKLKIEVPTDLAVSATFSAPARATGTVLDETGGALELDLGGDGGPRTWRIGNAVAEDPASQAAWQVADLRHGLPRLPASQREQWTPQQLALDRLAAYSVKKGCYPGQEIVARTHFLGKAKRSLQCFASDNPVADGAPVRENDREVGEVVCTTPDHGGSVLLAVMPLEHAGTDLVADGHLLTRQPLLDGLRR
ncbi:folate-binding protein YgfZ [Pseudoxanthomonas sp. PXM02]|uniref:CAF17-like 4Fe-4S cluster assembly/insertion protein YgfZ n=1 Tax=Pseudoxanthomonas sp. PXM02 TaxID=2769294 RepID=UPI0017816581|nr:folate-binding protein YgfZ [Pseudoxanthomonas sp. PXM02]MBD9480119.1 folate-binding protein YgfZ [Pseudoxanthomonas sp. PXM02]